MKALSIVISLFLMAYSFGAAAIVPADFSTGVEGVAAHFSTDLYFDAGMSCVYSGRVLSGTPCSGASTVCPGGHLYVVPSINALWARTYAEIISSYPYCSGTGYCPGMITYSTLNTNRNIKWLGDSMFDDYDVSDDGAGHNVFPLHNGAEGITRYNELATFHAERMGYYNVSGGTIYTNKRGDANVFCNANVEVRRGSTTLDTQEIDGIRIVDVPLMSEGTTTVSTRLTGTRCFAGAVKNPLDTDNPPYFQLLLYGYNTPSISMASTSGDILVEDRQPLLTIIPPIGITQSGAIPNAYLLSINTRNNGDVPVRVTGVRPIGDGTAGAFGGMDCMLYGFPPSICPSDNGFGSTINAGATKRVYVLFGGELDGDIAYLIYEPLQPICSDATSFNATIHIDSGNTPVRCEIDPSTLPLTQFEIHEWDVTCYNSLSLIVPCAGDNWYFFDAYGAFVDKTDERARAYVSSIEGVSPMLVYQTGSVRCTSELSIHPDEPTSSNDPNSFVCELSPDSAELDIGESQGFTLDCTLEGVPVEPASAEYSNVHGLDGSLSGASTDGVTFTGTINSSGEVQVIAWYGTPADPTLLGAIDWAHVVVGIGGNETNETGGGEKGDICELSPSYKEMYAHSAGFVGILCGGPGERVPCSSTTTIEWGVAPELHGGIISGTTSGATFSVGSDGTTPAYGYHTAGVSAVITNSEGEALGHCWADIFINEPSCLDYT
ncbi:hypothetical protein H0O02_01730 [Candidatus Micrarchaeota archaeon]|nr:hypothetical protein [Candidatus Micrarchaeota archaeon]